MKNLTRIADRLYNKPWLILPSSHRQLRAAFENYLKGNMALPYENDNKADDNIPAVAQPSVAIIPVYGTLGHKLSGLEMECGGVSTEQIQDALRMAANDESVNTIVLDFHSPGGEVTNIAETGELIASIAKEKDIIAYTSGMCCSAAYWLASQCTAVYSSKSATVGSVGVYSLLFDETEALEKEGLKVYPVYNGEFKLDGASFIKYNTEDRLALLEREQAGVDKIAKEFRAVINSKRDIQAQWLEGQVYDGEEAAEYGFTDGIISSLEELLTELN